MKFRYYFDDDNTMARPSWEEIEILERVTLLSLQMHDSSGCAVNSVIYIKIPPPKKKVRKNTLIPKWFLTYPFTSGAMESMVKVEWWEEE